MIKALVKMLRFNRIHYPDTAVTVMEGPATSSVMMFVIDFKCTQLCDLFIYSLDYYNDAFIKHCAMLDKNLFKVLTI